MRKQNLWRKRFLAIALSTTMVCSIFPTITITPTTSVAAATEDTTTQKITTAEDGLEDI